MTGGRGNLRFGVLVLVVALLGIAVWTIARDDDGDSSSTVGAKIATVDELRERAAEQGTPIYWAGAQEGAELELNVPEESRTYVRYLTDGAAAGDPRPEFLTIGTYSFPNAVAALEELSEQPGGVKRTAPGEGVVYFNRNRPESVYLAYPGVDVQVEVYDPDPQRAKNLVTSGQIVPVG